VEPWKALKMAAHGGEEDLRRLISHPSEDVLAQLLSNPALTEEVAFMVASRKNLTPGIISLLHQNPRWRESYRIMLTVCRNPKTPQSVSLSLLKSIRIFDLADLTRNRNVPANVKMAAEAHIGEKMLSLPLGIKITLARKGSGNILLKLLEDGMKEVIPVCLESPVMTEGILIKAVSSRRTASHVIRLICSHPLWRRRRGLRIALIRNVHAPLSKTIGFLPFLTLKELRELYGDTGVAPSMKPFIFRELADREVDDIPGGAY
jgi:hypothetical protein